ncbi:MAG: ATP synthase F1 subunit delta [Nitrospirae bacterium]|nr:ATP synthase F1 subunit delta [Nitrospirota bacterium]
MDFVTAGKYARAIFEAALAKGEVDAVYQDLEAISKAIEQDPRTRLLLTSPMTLSKAKEKIAETIGRKVGAGPSAIRAFKVVASRGRAGLLQPIMQRLSRLRDEQANRVRIEVGAAREPSPETLERLKGLLGRALGKTVVFETRIDPDLLGGLRLRIEDTLIDGSLRYQLECARRDLESVRRGAGTP